MKILFVGGTFDDYGGKPSSIVAKFSYVITKRTDIELALYNGGYFSEIEKIIS